MLVRIRAHVNVICCIVSSVWKNVEIFSKKCACHCQRKAYHMVADSNSARWSLVVVQRLNRTSNFHRFEIWSLKNTEDNIASFSVLSMPLFDCYSKWLQAPSHGRERGRGSSRNFLQLRSYPQRTLPFVHVTRAPPPHNVSIGSVAQSELTSYLI